MADLPCPLRAAAVHAGDQPALDAGSRILSFRDLDEWVEGTAARIRASGLTIGSRAALWMENDWRMVVLLLAALRAGVVACPLSTRLPSVESEIDLLKADVLISDRRGIPSDQFLARSETVGDVRHSSALHATVVFTSGSSGSPKAALHSYGNHIFSADGSNRNISVRPGDRWLLSLPLYHVGGIAIIFRCLLGRGTIVLRPGLPLRQAVSEATHLSLVSTQLLRLVRSDVRVPGLKAVLLGGGAMPRRLIDMAVERGLPIHTSYGLTEMASQVTTTGPNATRDELGTSGRILSHRELTIDSDGQILVRGKTRFIGYVDGPIVSEPFLEGGWYGTGDVGRFTNAGLLEVLGRIDNMFVSGGENVTPEEIERALVAVGGVERVIVVDVEDDEFGRRPVAFIDSGDSALEPPALRAALAHVLPRYKIPVRFFSWPDHDAPFGMKEDRAFFRRKADALMKGTTI